MLKNLLYRLIKKISSTKQGSILLFYLVLRNKLVFKFFDFLLKKQFINIISIISSIFAAKELKKLCNKKEKIEDIIELAFSFKYLLPFKAPCYLRPQVDINTFQLKSEILDFLKIVKKYQPKIVLEIGTASGGTFFLLTRFSHPKSLLISIDLPGGIHGGGYPSYKIPFYRSFARNRQKIILLREDSHAKITLQKVKKILKERKIDLLFIDGDHRYEGVKKDFEMYRSLVKKKGIIAFHDIAVHPPIANTHVNIFWDEIKKNFEYIELLEDKNQGGYGIGVLFMNS